MYTKLVIKVSAIDIKISSTSGLVTKTQYNTDKQRLEKKIEGVVKKITNSSGLIKKTNYNTKVTETENNVPSVTSLVTERLKAKYLIPHALLPLLILID